MLDLRRSSNGRAGLPAWAEPARLRSALAETGIEYRGLEEPERAPLDPIVELASRTLPGLARGSQTTRRAAPRSLLAARLEREHGLAVVDFRPPAGEVSA